jgi:hypothetical protein
MAERQNRALSGRANEQTTIRNERMIMQPGFVNTHSEYSVSRKNYSKLRFVIRIALLAALSGSIGCVYETRHAGYAESPPGYVDVQDDYVYYPRYEVYYSNHRHQYLYREGHSWVYRPAPPRVSAEVLFSSPSVRLDFHDHPSNHHMTVTRQYPKHWTPPGQSSGHNHGHGDRD